MGNWNPRTPSPLGSESRVASALEVILDDPRVGYLGRFKNPAATTITALHNYLRVVGAAPGVALEVLHTAVPAIAPPRLFFPGTATGAVTSGWRTPAGSTAAADLLTAIQEAQGQNWAENVAGRSANQPLDLLFRGATADQLAAGTRVASVRLRTIALYLPTTPSSAATSLVHGVLDIGGTRYLHPRPVEIPQSWSWRWLDFDWPLNPSTGLPWTRAQYNALLDGSTDEFGVRHQGRIAAQQFRCERIWLEPTLCAENRVGYAYAPIGVTDSGWAERALSGTVTPVANQWYWWLVYALTGTTGNALRLPLVRSSATPTTDPAATGEQRSGAVVNLSNPGGVVTSIASDLGAQFAPVLIDQSGIAAESQPFVETITQIVRDAIGGVRLTGDSGDHISCPDSVPLSITGDITVEFLIPLDDHTPASTVTLISKWGSAGQRSCRVRLGTSGNLIWSWTTDGTNELTLTSASTVGSIGAVDGYAFAWGRVRFDVDNGAAGRTAHFEYSFDRVTWTALGAAQTSATATSIFDSTAPWEVGSDTGGTGSLPAGVACGWKITADLTGVDVRADVSLVADPLDTTHPETLAAKVTDSTIVDAQANTWTLNGTLTFARYRVGQQVTTAAVTDYERIFLPVGWAAPGQRPDAPLIVEVYDTWVDAIEGASPVATGWLSASALADGTVRDVEVDLLATFQNTQDAQYVVVVSSAGSYGWAVPIADTRSNDLLSGSTTASEVHGATVGGATDSHVTGGGIPHDRYDLHVALDPAAETPSNAAVTVRAAA